MSIASFPNVSSFLDSISRNSTASKSAYGKKYWNSCSISEIFGTLETLIETDKEKKPVDIKSLYKRALECKEAINKIIREVVDKNEKLIKDRVGSCP